LRRLQRRLLHLVVVLFVVTFVTFTLVNLLPGDVSLAILGNGATPEGVARVRVELGLNDPLWLRYVHWLAQTVHGDFGRSYISGEPVVDALVRSVPVSVELMALSLILSISLAIPTGLVAAYRAGRPVDRALGAVASLLLAVPPFILGLALMFLLALALGWFPAVGYVPVSEGVLPNLRTLAIPAVTLALFEWPGYMLILRSDAIEVLQQDYVLLAKAKGLRDRRILFRHVLKPSSFTLLTVIGLSIAGLISGALIIENIFALPGVGRLIVGAINSRDFMVVQGAVTVVAVGYVLVNFAVDTLYAVLDPRVSR
jgi:peptide/nickel transport system permease protein